MPGASAPDGAAAGAQIVEAFVFEGRRVVPEADLQALAKPYAQRALTPADLEDLRLQLTRLYVERGYVNSGVVIPPNALRAGVLHLRIVEGRVTEVRVRGLQRLHEAYIAARLVRSDDEVLRLDTLQERFQLLLADPLISRLNGRVVPGAEPGQAWLDVDVQRARPYRVALFADNHRPPSVGSEAVGVQGTLWNLTGWGDALDATALRTRGSERYDLGWRFALPGSRTVLSLRGERGDASVVEEPVRSIDVVSKVDSLEAGLSHALVETLRERLNVGLSWGRRGSRTTLLGEPFSFTLGEPDGVSRVHAWRFFQEYVKRSPERVLALRSSLSGGRTNVAPELHARIGAAASRYLLWQGQLQVAQRLGPPGSQLVFRAIAQRSRDRLLPVERLAVGGAATVRGYRENQLVRDAGYVGSLEWQVPLPGADGTAAGSDGSTHRVELGPFIDFGSARNKGEAAERLASAGLRLQWRFGGLMLDLQAARRLRTPALAAHGNLQDSGVHVQLRQELP